MNSTHCPLVRVRVSPSLDVEPVNVSTKNSVAILGPCFYVSWVGDNRLGNGKRNRIER